MYVEMQDTKEERAYITFLAEVFAELDLEITPRVHGRFPAFRGYLIAVTWETPPSVQFSDPEISAVDCLALWALKHCDYSNVQHRRASDMRDFSLLVICFKTLAGYILRKTEGATPVERIGQTQ